MGNKYTQQERNQRDIEKVAFIRGMMMEGKASHAIAKGLIAAGMYSPKTVFADILRTTRRRMEMLRKMGLVPVETQGS